MEQYLLFIESNTTGTGMIAIVRAKELGFSPIFITNNPQRYKGLTETECKVIQCDTHSLSEIQQAITEKIETNHIAGITTTSDFYLETVAQLQKIYQLPGNSPEAIRACRHKGLMRQALERSPLIQPRFMMVRSVEEWENAARYMTFPCIVKPVDDSGSNEVKLCHHMKEVSEQVSRIVAIQANVRGQATAQTALIEEYLEGPEYSVEMFSDQQGTHCIGITQKEVMGKPYFVECGHLFPALLSKVQEQQIIEAVQTALEIVGYQFGPSHTEVRWTAQGPAIIEINARLAGGMIPELIRLATGMDLLEQQILTATGKNVELSHENKRVAGITFIMADQLGVLTDYQGTELAEQVAGIQLVKLTATKGSQVLPPQNAYHRLGYLIAAGDSHQQVQQSLAQATTKIQLHIEHHKEG
ncbi:ATP-grasp domain-containing protein [Hazenella coriacea]|uniref:Argininosuccinate lyase n=1 Tax=Hazenella coriacea TaxID=1179467 RepID=A0A4R3L0F1_9BACL|nr:ATP-grasp domain-containing protein [Hazenella coriacea]TCS92399.1 argininosuccinate lyase [Hazenella coriacea]